MKKLSIVLLVLLFSCSREKMNVDTKKVSGYVLTRGANNPVANLKVTIGTYGTIASSGREYAETTTDENGYYEMEFEEQHVGSYVFLDHYPTYDLVESTDDESNTTSAQIGFFENATKNFIVRPPATAQVIIKNNSGKYTRVEGALQHYATGSTFFKIEKEQTGIFLVPVWGDDVDSFYLNVRLIEKYGTEDEFKKDVSVNIPWGKVETFKYEF